MSSAAPVGQPQSIVACTISRDVQIFDLLIEDMETALGENWGDVSISEAQQFLQSSQADHLQFVALAIDDSDTADLSTLTNIVAAAKAKDIKVILITEEVSASALHRLLREGGDEFLPYPLPEGELSDAIDRMAAASAQENLIQSSQAPSLADGGGRHGAVIPVQGMAGGVGSTTFAVNLAWELANISKKEPPKVCLLDFDLQFGTTSTYLDLPRRETVLEMLTETETMDAESFMQALMTYQDKLFVLTSPLDMIPLEMITPEDISRIIDIAQSQFDYVIIDMPPTMVEWSQTVLEAAHVYFAMIELDMRCAQNTLRLKRALQSEELPFEKLRFILNNAPGFTDLSAKSRVKRLADSLGISIDVMMPDGGKPIAQTNDHGCPLALAIPKNPLRKEIVKLALSVHEVNQADESTGRE